MALLQVFGLTVTGIKKSGMEKSMVKMERYYHKKKIGQQAIKQSQLSSKDVELAVKSILEYMSQFLSEGGRIEIRGFGSFSLHYRVARIGRNPKTGEDVAISARRVVTFHSGQKLKARVEAYSDV